MNKYLKLTSLPFTALYFDGDKLKPNDTLIDVGIEDDDLIEAH